MQTLGNAREAASSKLPSVAIETLGLRKLYGHKVAVDGLTLTVASGEVFGFLGPNGAGKSTVVKMLMGLIYPTAGTARILGRPIGDIAAKARIGFLPEHFRFHEWLQAREFLEFHARLYGLSSARAQQRSAEVLELVGLAGRGNDRLDTFSKGMLQRIGIGQALLNDPEIVFLDEPTSALDPIGRRDVRDLIRILKRQGKTVFLNSHLLSEVEMVCDRVMILDRGRVVRQGLLADLLGGGQEVEVQTGGVTPELRQALSARFPSITVEGASIRVEVKDSEEVAAIAAIVIGAGGKLYGLTARKISLEDLFVAVVEGGADQ